MRPARFLFVSGAASVVVAALLSLVRVLNDGRLDVNQDVRLMTGSFEGSPLAASFMLLATSLSSHLLYFGVISLMLWSIWRDERAEWTEAASRAVKIGAACLALGALILWVWSYYVAANHVNTLATFGGRRMFILALGSELCIFGMTLWLHAIGSNQIPKLMELAVARRSVSIGWGLISFWAGVGTWLIQFVAMTASANAQVAILAGWVGGTLSYPLLLISYSLLSMGYIAKREIRAQEAAGAAL